MAEAGWWGRQWLEAFHSAFGEAPAEGAAARGGVRVDSLDVQAGRIFARAGSGGAAGQPVQIWMPPLAAADWRDALAGLRRSLARATAEMGPGRARAAVEEALAASGVPLVPARMSGMCGCTESRSPCSHLDALGAAFAAALARRPSLLLRFAGADPGDAAFLDDLAGVPEEQPRPQPSPAAWSPPPAPPAPPAPPVSAGVFFGPTPGEDAAAPAAGPSGDGVGRRRDLPLRIRQPDFWEAGPDVAAPLAALCRLLAEWAPPRGPHPAGSRIGFSPQELAALRAPVAAAPTPAAPEARRKRRRRTGGKGERG